MLKLSKLTLIINIVTRDYRNFVHSLWSFYETKNDAVNTLITLPGYDEVSQKRILEYGDIYHCDFIKSTAWLSPNEIRNISQSISDTPLYLYIEDMSVFKDDLIFDKIEDLITDKDYLIINNRCIAYKKNFFFNSNMNGFGYENFVLNGGNRIQEMNDLIYQRKYEFHDRKKLKDNLNYAFDRLNLSGEKRNYFEYY